MFRTYDIIAVFATERRNKQRLFPEVEQDRLTGKPIYIGGQARMLAAVKAAARFPQAEIVLVGGWEKQDESLLSKAEDMAAFVSEHVPGSKVRIVNSLPSTHGNIVALFNTFKNQKKNLAILSNDYHIKRIRTLCQKIGSESGYSDISPRFLKVSDFGINENVSTTEYRQRLEREQQGLRDLEHQSYRLPNRIDPKDIMKFYPDSLSIIFTPAEQKFWLNKQN
jgi:hypothetical protein